VFNVIISEQQVLKALYAPLMMRLASSMGTLRKLSFSVSRLVDADKWGEFAEELIDRRMSGPFSGRGSLMGLANSQLKPAWETGTAAQVQAAMTQFITTYWKALVAHAPYAPTQKQELRNWSRQFAQWLFKTDHITIHYEIAYDGVDIRKLSPGTRGIVLLLLYLALDDADDRPLIIDQPEENLDPKSVFDELVSLFVAAKSKRQVIMVTHNANLVINTDADQIIIANAGPHPAGGLPSITYVAGGLEEAHIRKAVCDILEGGEDAFRERARRLRVRLER
jgi:ABC-type hemin transport system ATPase subunit